MTTISSAPGSVARRGPTRCGGSGRSEIVVAAGAIERPLVVPDNDRPGVMSADAALVYLRRYGGPGRRARRRRDQQRQRLCRRRGLGRGRRGSRDFRHPRERPRIQAASVTRGVAIEGVVGARGVEAVRVGGRTRDCDALLLSGGWTPTVHLYAQARGRLRYDETLAALVPTGAIGDLSVAGAANGAFTLDDALRQGHRAGGGEGAAPNAPAGQYRIEAAWPKADDEGRRWIDFQNDVTLKDVALAAREGYVSVEHLKRYTTLGMATDQGKTANVNGLAAMAALTGRTIDETGATTYRPPFVPVPMRRHRRPAARRAHQSAEASAARSRSIGLSGAQMREYGGWLRPAWYGPDDPEQTIQREAARARDAVALFDGSSLGKIEIIGPDAAKLADFHSYNRLSNLKPGKIRYGFMLSEAGIVFDDGVTLRLGEDRFLVSCSSGHTDAVRMRLELCAAGSLRSRSRRRPRRDRAMGDAHRHGPARARPHRGLRIGRRARRPELAAHGVRDRRIRRRAAQGRAGELHWRPLLRTLRAGEEGRGFAGAPRREADGVRRRASGARGADDPARREGLHHRRQGHRRDDHAARPRSWRARATRGRTNISASAPCSCPSPTDKRRKQFVGLSVAAGEAPLPTGAHVVMGRARRGDRRAT